MNYVKRKQQAINPEENTNFFLTLLFTYTRKIFIKGFRTQLREEDIYKVLPSYESKKLGNKLELIYKLQKKQRVFSMLSFLWKSFGLQFLIIIATMLIRFIIIFLRTKVIKNFIAYFAKDHRITKSSANLYGAYLVMIVFLEYVFADNFQLRIDTFGIKIRTAFTSLIYRKVLKINLSQVEDISLGKIMTLITRDVNEFEISIIYVTRMIANFISFFGVCFILYAEVGWLVVILMSIFSVIVLMQMSLTSLIMNLTTNTLKKTDHRYEMTKEVLNGIRWIKFNLLEDLFKTKLSNSRKDEVSFIYKIFLLSYAQITLSNFLLNATWYLLIITSIYLADHISAATMFLIMDSLNNVSLALRFAIARGILETAKLMAVSKRIAKFLETKDQKFAEDENKEQLSQEIVLSDLSVYIKDYKILDNRTLKFQKGLTVITGPVGSGKTLLLKVLIREHQFIEGDVTVNGRISYASQEPWLFPSTIKQNILFSSSCDRKRYNEVLEVCALVRDLQSFDEGDSTMVANRGTNLSRGQQKRINLARAVYRESDFYLLDDCLSSLDVLVENFIFEKCIRHFLKDKIVVMVSQNKKHISRADHVIDLNDGTSSMKQNSSVQEVSTIKRSDMVRNINVEEQESSINDIEASETATLMETKIIEKNIYEESKELANVKLETYVKYFKHGGGIIMLSAVLVSYCAIQFTQSGVHKLQTTWINTEETIVNYTVHNSTDNDIYKNNIEKRHQMVYLIPLLTLLVGVLIMLKAAIFFLLAKKASLSIHKIVVEKIIGASIEFFDSNLVGNIFNRLSEDLLYIDEKIPISFSVVIESLIETVIITILVMTVNVVLVVPSLVFCMLIVITTIIYLRIGRPLKQLEISTRSPFLGHINATVEGLCTLRAAKAQNILRDEFDTHQNVHTSASYMYFCCLRAYGFLIHIYATVVIAFVVVQFLTAENDTSVGDVGLALSQMFLLTTAQEKGFRRFCRLIARMTAIQRILEYTKQKQERKNGTLVKNWPQGGEISFENVYLSYNNRSDVILNGLNFTVRSGEKIAVVGRTAAGKTSLISTLLRLYNIKGKIFFDAVDIATVPLDVFRSNISVVPQEPFLFSGTIRENIDPLRQYSDDRVWDVIKTINMETLFSNLEYKISGTDCSLSSGQKQLICLGRALIRNNKVVVLDEITANVDSEVEEMINKIIKERFINCTIIMITHKLNLIDACDTIMVLDGGRIIETDSLSVLLNDRRGMFYNMLKMYR